MKNTYVQIFLVVFFISYYIIFIYSYKLSNPKLVSVCSEGNKIKIELRDSFSYISNYKSKIDKDTLIVTIYKTSMANIFERRKRGNIYIDRNNIQYVYIAGRYFSLEKLKCY